jgi:hypothetical protein
MMKEWFEGTYPEFPDETAGIKTARQPRIGSLPAVIICIRSDLKKLRDHYVKHGFQNRTAYAGSRFELPAVLLTQKENGYDF